MADSRILLFMTASILLIMQGCSVTPTAKTQPEQVVIPPEPTPVLIPDTPVEETVATTPAVEEQHVSNCVFHPNKGIAEVEKVEQGKWTMRFYPGDIAFVHHSEDIETSPGEEFRALRYSRTSGPCDSDYFELLGAFN